MGQQGKGQQGKGQQGKGQQGKGQQGKGSDCFSFSQPAPPAHEHSDISKQLCM